MFQMLGLIAEFERSMIRGPVVSGMAHARTTGTKSGRAIGRPTLSEATKDAIRGLLETGQSERAIVQQLGSARALWAVCGPLWRPQQVERHEGSQDASDGRLTRLPRTWVPLPPAADGTQGRPVIDTPHCASVVIWCPAPSARRESRLRLKENRGRGG
jgi:hypothetical protein